MNVTFNSSRNESSFERTRLQPCRNNRNIDRALAPEGMNFLRASFAKSVEERMHYTA